MIRDEDTVENEKKDTNMFDRYHAFATNMSCASLDDNGESELLDHIPDECKKRWGIETGYRCVEEIRPRTTSLNPSVRLTSLFYGIGNVQYPDSDKKIRMII